MSNSHSYRSKVSGRDARYKNLAEKIKGRLLGPIPVDAFLQEFGFVKATTPPVFPAPNLKHKSEKQMYIKFVRAVLYFFC